jgi:hypothetical protein
MMHRILPLLRIAYDALQDAQAHADALGRGTLAHDLDSLRWSLGDFVAEYADDLTSVDETWPGPAQSTTTVGTGWYGGDPNQQHTQETNP